MAAQLQEKRGLYLLIPYASCLLICAAGAALGFVTLNGWAAVSSAGLVILLIAILAPAVPLSIQLGEWRAGRRRRKRLRDAGYQVCQSCGYDLQNLPVSGRCPECGSYYDIETSREAIQAELTSQWRLERRSLWNIRRLPLERIAFGTATMAAVLGLFLVLAIVVNQFTKVGDETGIFNLSAMAGMTAAAVALSGVLFIMARRHVRRHVLSAGYFVCPVCLQPLPTNGERGMCEGCGLPFTIDSVRATWCGGFLRLRVRLRRTDPVAPTPPLGANIGVIGTVIMFGVVYPLFIFKADTKVGPVIWFQTGLMATASFVFVFVASVCVRRLRRKAATHDCFLCLHCHSALPTDLESGNCPRCGRPFVARRVRAIWALY